MSDAVFIKDPSRLLWAYLARNAHTQESALDWFLLGQMAMALEVITVIKSLEGIPIVSDRGRVETISVLQTLLVDTDMADHAYDLYEELNEWRKPRFQDSEASVEQVFGDVLAHAIPGGWIVQGDSSPALRQVHQSPPPSDEPEDVETDGSGT